jgi:tetratricopeptide repeat protein
MKWFAAILSVLLLAGCSKPKSTPEVYVPRPKGTLTFTRDIAPIMFKQCATCHRQGQAAPFSLLTYADVQKRAKQIAEVTASRYMPPWMPAPGYVEFAGERRLTTDQLGMIQQWSAEGAPEGNPADLPPQPKWTEGWQLGEPDLVVTMPVPYTLPAEGKDVYRNFVVPIPLQAARYVRAIEFNPGNWKVVHHAFFRFDRTGDSRAADERDPGVGFGGIHTPQNAEGPQGHFLGWQPGRVFSEVPEGLFWELPSGLDLVLQLHLQPSGKPETVQSSMAFYFTDRPPTNSPSKIALSSYHIDIPPGVSNYVVTDSAVLPTDLRLLAVQAHAHYLGKEIEGIATLPDGSKKWLLKIDRWDFNWQNDYRYAEPIFLPKGSTVTMKVMFDNSEQNPRNPNHPPKRVRYGVQTTDEMAEFWLQVLTVNAEGTEALRAFNFSRVIQDGIAYNQHLLKSDPNDASAHNGLGKAMYFAEKLPEALNHLKTAVELKPALDEAHYFLGLICRRQNRLAEAKEEFLTVLRLNPTHSKAAGNLGLISLQEGDLASAEAYFSQALSLDPQDGIARKGLNDIVRLRR